MNKELKLTVKSEVKKIIEEIEYEEYQFNRIFHSDISFQKSYWKFQTIYDKYGKEAYLKYVPLKYKRLEIKGLILDKNYVEIYDHYGINAIRKLLYTKNLYRDELKVSNKFKLLIIKLKKLFSRNYVPLPSNTVLLLPESIEENVNMLNIK